MVEMMIIMIILGLAIAFLMVSLIRLSKGKSKPCSCCSKCAKCLDSIKLKD
jgi:hypothetical protein